MRPPLSLVLSVLLLVAAGWHGAYGDELIPPAAAFDACRMQSAVANSESLVRFDDNDYSVPVAYAHHPVVVRGYMDRVEVGCRRQVIAVHPR